MYWILVVVALQQYLLDLSLCPLKDALSRVRPQGERAVFIHCCVKMVLIDRD